MISFLLLFSTLAVVEFQPSNVQIEYSYISDTKISIALAINSLTTRQSIVITDENLIGSNGIKYPVDLSITVEPTLIIDIPVKEISTFTPSKIIQIEDMLCGSTTLNSPCAGKKTLCCVDLYKGVNYFRCHSSTGISYRRYKMGDISSTIGFKISVTNRLEQAEYKLFHPNHDLIAENKNLRLHFSFQADSSVEGVLSVFQNNSIIRTSDSESIDSLHILLAEDTFMFTEDEWINKSSCYNEIDEEFDILQNTIEVSLVVGNEYSGFLLNNAIHLAGNLDMILYLSISASK